MVSEAGQGHAKREIVGTRSEHLASPTWRESSARGRRTPGKFDIGDRLGRSDQHAGVQPATTARASKRSTADRMQGTANHFITGLSVRPEVRNGVNCALDAHRIHQAAVEPIRLARPSCDRVTLPGIRITVFFRAGAPEWATASPASSVRARHAVGDISPHSVRVIRLSRLLRR
jgi:hypothetical protein